MNFLKLLVNPIFLLAAGLHAGLLMIPVAGGLSDEIVPPPDPEGESITVTRIPPAKVQPTRPGAATGPTTAPQTAARPVATGVTRVRPATSSQQQQASRSQDGRRSNDRTVSRDSSSSRAGSTRSSNRSNRSESASRDSSDELAVLSPPVNDSNAANPSPSNNTPRPSAIQEPPTLAVLREGIQSQGVPKLLQDFLARLSHSVLKTTDPEVEEAKRIWLDELADQPGLDVSSVQALDKPLQISYPLTVEYHGPRQLRRCLSPLPKAGLVGVIVDSNGAIATEPTLLRSSGYEFLNDIALDKIQAYADFPEASSQQIYTVDVEVDYDKNACVDLAKLRSN
ncbi:MAG: hypothetical protein AAGA46_13675 [Cyanobacteria bacterium P01_F01_bin.13]